jgi:hypothetical protein
MKVHLVPTSLLAVALLAGGVGRADAARLQYFADQGSGGCVETTSFDSNGNPTGTVITSQFTWLGTSVVNVLSPTTHTVTVTHRVTQRNIENGVTYGPFHYESTGEYTCSGVGNNDGGFFCSQLGPSQGGPIVSSSGGGTGSYGAGFTTQVSGITFHGFWSGNAYVTQTDPNVETLLDIPPPGGVRPLRATSPACGRPRGFGCDMLRSTLDRRS